MFWGFSKLPLAAVPLDRRYEMLFVPPKWWRVGKVLLARCLAGNG